MLVFLLVLLVALAVATMYAKAARHSADLPDGVNIAGSDLGTGVPLTLRDTDEGLVGCPDLLLKRSDRWILIEKKPASREWRPGTSYRSHRLQVGTYMLMCEADPQIKQVPEAWIHYVDGDGHLMPGGRVQVHDTPELRAEVREIIGQIRRDAYAVEVHRSHGRPGRCRGCGIREACGEALAGGSANGSS